MLSFLLLCFCTTYHFFFFSCVFDPVRLHYIVSDILPFTKVKILRLTFDHTIFRLVGGEFGH